MTKTFIYNININKLSYSFWHSMVQQEKYNQIKRTEKYNQI